MAECTLPSEPGRAIDPELLRRLRESAAEVDASSDWPRAQLEWLADAGVLRWNLPGAFGGEGCTAVEMTAGYEALAAACLTTTFILTQRNAACQRIIESDNAALQQELLPDLASGRCFSTVGISHLTTSRQHLAQPAVRIDRNGNSLVLNGAVPWVTGAAAADVIVTGGTCADGRQMLIALPRGLAGLTVAPPTRLLALNASQTSAMQLDDVRVTPEQVIAGPVEGVMGRSPSGGTGSVTTSALAVGLTGRALGDLEAEAEVRPELEEIVAPLREELESVRSELYGLAGGLPPQGITAATLRQRANSLVLRSTQAQLAASKGAGYVAGHPAERGVREALFFLVWSCPQPVVAAALREFACIGG